MKVSLIITTYNWPDALALTLKSIINQSLPPNEVIVADDGSKQATKKLIEDLCEEVDFPLLHSWQEDEGFRLAMSRNRAIAKATGDYIIIIDGDLILHEKFIEDHISNAKRGVYLQGGRVLLNKEISYKLIHNRIDFSKLTFFSKDIQNRKNALRIPFIAKTIAQFNHNTLKGIKGCNFSLFKDDILAVNGFDNRFVGWGREDSEFVSRLINRGFVRRDLKFAAVAYHLYHEESTRESLAENDMRLKRTIEEKLVRCEDGIDRFIKESK